jgi:hypothetical protein
MPSHCYRGKGGYPDLCSLRVCVFGSTVSLLLQQAIASILLLTQGRDRSGLFRLLDHVPASVHPLSGALLVMELDRPHLLLSSSSVKLGSQQAAIRRPRSRHVHLQRSGLFHITATHGDNGEEDDDESTALLG